MGIPGRRTREKVQSHNLLEKQRTHLRAPGIGPAEGMGKVAQAKATKSKAIVSNGRGDASAS